MSVQYFGPTTTQTGPWKYHHHPVKRPPGRRQDKQAASQYKTTHARSSRPVAGLSEPFGRVYKAHGVHMYNKPPNTLRSRLVHPKDKTPMEHQCGTIYQITCDTDPKHTLERPKDHSFRGSKNTVTWNTKQESVNTAWTQDTQSP